jgi:predicted GH43/DUF377 family glycosyl hydrolase
MRISLTGTAVLLTLAVLISSSATLVGSSASSAISTGASVEFSYRALSEWDLLLPSGLYYDTGPVVYHGGRFHMFYNCQYEWPPQEVSIMYAVSDDGVTWERVSQGSIVAERDIPYRVSYILAGSAFVENDGTWVLYFCSQSAPVLIGRATAPSPEGPWTVDPEPVLVPSAKGWDSYSVRRPDVVRVADGYRMYYLGIGQAGSMVGMASSSDGIHWTRYNDPDTTDPLYAESDPVFALGGGGTGGLELRYPRVLPAADGWLLFYWTSTPGWPQADKFAPTNGQIRLASSRDGVHWTSAQEDPVLTPEDIGGDVSAIYTPCIVVEGDTYYMFLEKEIPLDDYNYYTRIVLAIHAGLIYP